MVWSAGEGAEGGAVEREGAGRLRMVTGLRRGENLLSGEPYLEGVLWVSKWLT